MMPKIVFSILLSWLLVPILWSYVKKVVKIKEHPSRKIWKKYLNECSSDYLYFDKELPEINDINRPKECLWNKGFNGNLYKHIVIFFGLPLFVLSFILSILLSLIFVRFYIKGFTYKMYKVYFWIIRSIYHS